VKKMAVKSNAIIASGKRKSAIARATITPGSGKVTINNCSIEAFQPAIARLKMQEPLILAGKAVEKLDFEITVNGGGYMGQTQAARLAIARALVEKDKKLKEVFLDYDRQLLVADVRRKEMSKPNSHGKARAKRQKSYR
jgi:small subunit ribosomal protein S9